AEAEVERQSAFCAEVKAQLQRTLPEYMVPSQYLLLVTLPLTPNGKLDRKALPAVEGNVLQRTYEAPATPLEEQLAAIWQNVLSIERVGRQDNFFELGGNSISAVRLVSSIKAKMDVHVPLRLLFERFTLENLAAHVEGAGLQLTDAGMSDIENLMDELIEGSA
ncbi:MAG TPA: phosphopantetheine-binding protein, partial [Hyphomicrobiales bacterium]|nr:phosphopantetheine-binding protein [Hyphomicrobiales bacterium]